MKILIIGITKIKYMPYMNFYLDNIDATVNEVHYLLTGGLIPDKLKKHAMNVPIIHMSFLYAINAHYLKKKIASK